jgi:serine/threonine-protein kinase
MKTRKIAILWLFLSCIFATGCSFTIENNNTKLENNEINDLQEVLETTEELQNTTSKDFVEYENKKYNFKIKIPGNRTFQEDNLWFDIKLNTPKDDDINENLWIIVQELQVEQDIDSYVETTVKELKTLFTDFVEKEIKNTESNDWKSIIYEFSEEWLDLKAQQTVFIQDNKAYVFTYTATKDTFNEYIDTVNQIINSFTILN